jgi:hypothetical protein
MKLNKFISEERENMLNDLRDIVADLKKSMRISPNEYTEYGCDEPSIDVRLCVDLSERGDSPSWIIRTGSVDFDSYHSEFCSASCIGLSTEPEELLEELVNGLDE